MERTALPRRLAWQIGCVVNIVDETGQDKSPLGQLRAVLDELVVAGVLAPERRDGIEYPIWSTVHGLAVLTGQGPLRDAPDATRRKFEQLTLLSDPAAELLPPLALSTSDHRTRDSLSPTSSLNDPFSFPLLPLGIR